MSKSESKSQVVSVRLNEEQIDFLNQVKQQMESDLEASVAMGTVVRHIISKVRHKKLRGMERSSAWVSQDRFLSLEARVTALENEFMKKSH
ncbi:hypothetical protein [Dongshaea marina]|uniref:hypothetical protein n=1 Tax=Dongshaea marina TaxID=2047966 RepID=UPI000D3EA10F|nr:hypothetical protein [Dongshaea marina]